MNIHNILNSTRQHYYQSLLSKCCTIHCGHPWNFNCSLLLKPETCSEQIQLTTSVNNHFYIARSKIECAGTWDETATPERRLCLPAKNETRFRQPAYRGNIERTHSITSTIPVASLWPLTTSMKLAKVGFSCSSSQPCILHSFGLTTLHSRLVLSWWYPQR